MRRMSYIMPMPIPSELRDAHDLRIFTGQPMPLWNARYSRQLMREGKRRVPRLPSMAEQEGDLS